jgi:hypothetical protein
VKLRLSRGQVLRYYEDPTVGTVDSRELKDYVGKYKVAPGKTLTILRQGPQLFLQRQDKPKVELIPEASPIFFRKGVEGRALFRRAAEWEGGCADRPET